MSLKGLLSSRNIAAPRSLGPVAASIMSDGDRLAMLDELEQSGLGWFWASDENSHLTYLSRTIAARLDVPLTDLIGQPLTGIFTAADREQRGKSLALMLGAHRAFTGIAVRASRGGGDIVLRLSGQPALNTNGHFIGFRGTGADITDEYYREEENDNGSNQVDHRGKPKNRLKRFFQYMSHQLLLSQYH